ncbi:MAG: VWA domain-containing protein [Planctomycetes bacterium]|nr:VWA domain-containing protein [Planctomycetota bacterium]
MPKRLAVAIAVSLFFHGVLASAYFLIPPDPPRRVVRLVDVSAPPGNFKPLALALEDLPPPAVPIVSKKMEPITPSVEPKLLPKLDGPPAHEAIATNPNPIKAAGATGSGAIIPLHGKLTRAGLTIVYVLDCSGSMAQAQKLGHAINLLKTSLKQLGPDTRFQIVVFDSIATPLRLSGNLEPVHPNSTTIAEATKLLNSLRGEGSSRHIEGLIAGSRLRPDIMILLTDTDEIPSKDLKRFQQVKGKNVALHTIVIGSDAAPSTPSELASVSQVHRIALPAQAMLSP